MNTTDMSNIQSHTNGATIRPYALLLLLLFWGCADKFSIYPPNSNGNTTLPDGRIVFSLHTSSPSFAHPITRSGTADEDNVTGDLWVFVFDAQNPNADEALFLEAVKTSNHEAAANGASKRTAILQLRTHKVTLLILDNAPTTIYNGSTNIPITNAASWGLTSTTTIASARSLLNTTQLSSTSESTVPYTPNLTIPLSQEFNYPTLDSSTPLGTEASPLRLQRTVAKVTIRKSFTAGVPNASFTLKGATAYNTPRNASLFPVHKGNNNNLTNYIGAGAGNEIVGIAAAINDDTAPNPIYLYPSAEATAAHQPFILIQAQYGTDTQDTYYKLTIAPAAKEHGKVDRNTNYSFLIKSCTGRGYISIADAAANAPSNLVYTMEITDLSSHDILDNGQYYMALSNSEYIVVEEGSPNNLVAATLHTGNNLGTSPFASIVSITATTGITVINPTIAHPATNQSIIINITDTFTTGSISLKLGNLTKTIPIARTAPSFSFTGGVLTSFTADDYVVGEVIDPIATPWVKLSASPSANQGLNHIAVNNGGIYLHIAPNTNSAPRSAELHLARQGYLGRIKLRLTQKKAPDTP